MFDIAIQTGAIFAVIWCTGSACATPSPASRTTRAAQRFALNVLIAFVPAVVLGLLFGKAIKAHLFTPVVGGQHLHRRRLDHPVGRAPAPALGERDLGRVGTRSVDDMTPLDALKVGLVQCLALMPGTSRSGATIIGGMLFGLSPQGATDFSFFLGHPHADRRRRLSAC